MEEGFVLLPGMYNQMEWCEGANKPDRTDLGGSMIQLKGGNPLMMTTWVKSYRCKGCELILLDHGFKIK